MADIRWVILSDLHFGAENSLLTSLVRGAPSATSTGFRVEEATPSPVLANVLAGLAQLTAGQARPPHLLLAGDVLDLALSGEGVSSSVFGLFARLAFGGPAPVFDPLVYYLPGNHDHHLWETAREARYVASLASAASGGPMPDAAHVTGLRPDDESPPLACAWLEALLRRESSVPGLQVRVAYPNMALVAPSGARAVVVSHGHFSEPVYTLMSQLKDMLYPEQRPKRFDDVARWELENFAWIDFLWSTLGRSGEVGDDVGVIYADMASPSDIDALASNLMHALLRKGRGPRWLHGIEAGVLDAVFRYEASHHLRSERGTTDTALSASARSGLRAYLEEPVQRQLAGLPGGVPQDVTFVFGHTHKPFAERWALGGFPGVVTVLNTGGWVVDTSSPAPVQGGVAVLVDDDLDVAPLVLYRQDGPSSVAPVGVLPAAAGEPPSPFRTEVGARIDPHAGPWAALTASASALVAERYELQEETVRLYRATKGRRRS